MSSHQEYMRQKCSQVFNDDFMENVKIAQLLRKDPFFFGAVVTKDEKVYTIGTFHDMSAQLIRVLHRYPPPKLAVMETLCGQMICEFASGTNHCLALSEGGVVYAWGWNTDGQLGDDSSNDAYSAEPVIVGGALADETVTHIACGAGFSVVRTANGKVFSWGSNVYGRTGHHDIEGMTTLPKQVESLSHHRIVSILAGNLTVMCLTDKGRVFAFGYGANGQIGVGTSERVNAPQQVLLPKDAWIQQLAGGSHHTLALTNTGKLFAWGYNKYGQVGNGTKDLCLSPTQINFSIDESFNRPLMSIYSDRDTCYALDVRGLVYVWGRWTGNENISRPAPKPGLLIPTTDIKLLPTTCGVVGRELLKSFDDNSTADLIISVEGKDIHVHRTILKLRSSYFSRMLSETWREARDGKIEIDHTPYDTYKIYLRYLYSAHLPELDLAEELRLLELAKFVLDDTLRDLCIDRVKSLLRFCNVAHVFSTAISTDLPDLADYCIRYAMRGLKRVLDSGSFKKLSCVHVRDFYEMCRGHGTYTVDA